MMDMKKCSDVVFFDVDKDRERHLRLYDNLTLEMEGESVGSIVCATMEEYKRYVHIIGKNIK